LTRQACPQSGIFWLFGLINCDGDFGRHVMTFRKYVGGLQLDTDNGRTTLIFAVKADVDMPDADGD
jgi:hypothetical protein